MDISIASIERLHRHQIYPIVLLIKFKSTKQIKEVKDSRYPSDKVSAKAAKEMYEQALKLEAEYRHFITGKWIFVHTTYKLFRSDAIMRKCVCCGHWGTSTYKLVTTHDSIFCSPNFIMKFIYSIYKYIYTIYVYIYIYSNYFFKIIIKILIYFNVLIFFF